MFFLLCWLLFLLAGNGVVLCLPCFRGVMLCSAYLAFAVWCYPSCAQDVMRFLLLKMARALDFIKDINDGKELWKFAVRLEDIWKTGIGKGEHLEFIILDKQVKFCDHPFTLVGFAGDGGSDIIPTKIPNIPKYKFNFKSFDEIKHGKYRADLLVDIIGVVHEVKPDKKSFGSKKLPTTFSLADAMNILTCSLWGKYQTEFLAKYNENACGGPVIVILKHAAIKEPQGIYDLQITNAWSGTKLIMDQDFKEAKDFKALLPPDFLTQTQSSNNLSEGSSLQIQNSQSSKYSAGSRYAFRAPVTHISQLITLPEEEIVTTVATPHHVCLSKHGWYYKSFAECSKQLITDTPPYKCKVDAHVTPEPIIKVEAEVRYEGHKAKFLFWDRECTDIIGKTASELQAIMLEAITASDIYFIIDPNTMEHLLHAGAFDPHEYPVDLDKITGIELAFKIRVEAEVRYEGHKAKFLFWDRECTDLIGKTASELQAIMLEAGAFDPHEYPVDLDKITGIELAFKVKIQAKGKLSSVLTLKDDPEIIQYLKDQLILTEIPSQLSLPATNLGEVTLYAINLGWKDLSKSGKEFVQ
ncbi:hypothetical protein QL285_051823 [Trifolium repens]|nr:hypothetical protein QL285_051823 [Trifolium repens]